MTRRYYMWKVEILGQALERMPTRQDDAREKIYLMDNMMIIRVLVRVMVLFY